MAGPLRYRLFRNPFVMFVFGPFGSLLIGLGSSPGACARGCGQRLGTDLALALARRDLLLVGWKAFLLVQPAAAAHRRGRDLALLRAAPVRGHVLAASDAWSFDEAALQGSSHLELPRILRSSPATSGCTTCTT